MYSVRNARNNSAKDKFNRIRGIKTILPGVAGKMIILYRIIGKDGKDYYEYGTSTKNNFSSAYNLNSAQQSCFKNAYYKIAIWNPAIISSNLSMAQIDYKIKYFNTQYRYKVSRRKIYEKEILYTKTGEKRVVKTDTGKKKTIKKKIIEAKYKRKLISYKRNRKIIRYYQIKAIYPNRTEITYAKYGTRADFKKAEEEINKRSIVKARNSK